ncbi:hypothetical protein Aduo_013092 [Ancylostoma duodenale]
MRLWVPAYIPLFSAFLPVCARKLTTEENQRNAQRCGAHFLGEDNNSEKRLSKRIIGGRQVMQNEYPWTVLISKGLWGGKCSGVQISPRHVLTAAHCVAEFDRGHNNAQCHLNRSYNAVSVMMKPENILVFVGINKANFSGDSILPLLKAKHSAIKVTVHNFDYCGPKNDLALIELNQNISENRSTPICMPTDGLQLHRVLYTSGFGWDPAVPVTPEHPLRYRGQQVVAQHLHGEDEISHKILTLTFAKGVMYGDSGGPLFQVDNSGIHTLVGITSSAEIPDKFNSDTGRNNLDFYMDVRAYVDWICKHSGVCPVEEMSSEENPSDVKQQD